MIHRRPRVLFYVQHLLGIGHLKRASLIGHALDDSGLDCHMVLGGPPVDGIDWRDATIHRLAEVRAADGRFSALIGADGSVPDAVLWAARRDRLLVIEDELNPDAVIVELYPFGRRAFGRELLALLERVHRRKPRPAVFCSLRDILIDKGRSDRAGETIEIVKSMFDEVLVHGDPDFTPLEATFPRAVEISDQLFYTGYVMEPADSAVGAPNDEVIVSAGGGAVGAALLTTAMAAKPLSLLSNATWRFLTGPNLDPAVVERLRESADSETVVEPNRSDFANLLSGARLSISQGGYNTVMDIVRTRCPAVVVPFADGGESEQTTRAERLAEARRLVMVNAAELTPESLAAAADKATLLPRISTPPFMAGGAEISAGRVARRIENR